MSLRWCLLSTHSRNSRVLRLGTLSFRWILKCRRHIRWVRTTESLFLKYVSTAKARCSTDQRSIATEMLWVSLEGRSKTNSPHQQFHSQLCCQIVRYFCRVLYFMQVIYNYIPGTNHVGRVYVTAILWLQFMVHVMLFSYDKRFVLLHS